MRKASLRRLRALAWLAAGYALNEVLGFAGFELLEHLARLVGIQP